MKKYLFICGLVGTALFTACSSADDLVKEVSPEISLEEQKAMIVEAGKDSDVPITLGSVGSRRIALTRTPLDSDEGLFETPYNPDVPSASRYLGVYCLATGKQQGIPTIEGIIPSSDDEVKWNGSSYYAKWLENVPARVVKHAAETVSPIDGGYTQNYSYVQFMKDNLEKVYYYPFGNWYHYDFFAYYPRQESIETIAKACYANLTIDGSDDIIWGKASGIIPDPLNPEETITLEVDDDATGNKVKAYSAKYMRLMKEMDEDGDHVPDNTEIEVVPELAFNHLLTQLVFSVKPRPDDVTELSNKGFRLTSLALKNVYNTLRLCVASKESPNAQGTNVSGILSKSGGVSDVKVWISVDDDPLDDTNPLVSKDPFGTIEDPITIPVVPASYDPDVESTHKTFVGYVMVPPTNIVDKQYMVSIGMEQKDDAGNYPGDPVPDTIILLTPPEGGFKAGYKYNITLEIYNPTNIQAKATLTGWEEVEETIIGVE
jgi:hypothetical protein